MTGLTDKEIDQIAKRVAEEVYHIIGDCQQKYANPVDKAKLAKQLEKERELGCSFDSNTVKAWREEPLLGRLLVKKVVDEKVSYKLAEKEKIEKPYKMVALNPKGFQIESWSFKEQDSLLDNFIRVCRL